MNYGSSLNINTFLKTISSILDGANKIIPIYNESKPIISNIIKFKNNLNKTNISDFFQKFNKNNTIERKNTKKIKEITDSSYSSPQFFL